MNYYIGEFSKKFGISIDTLRYYEKIGLIYPERDNINKRVYCDKDIEWLKFIMRLKETNMPIKQIQHYSKLRYEGDNTLQERLELLEEQMGRLRVEKVKIEENMSHLLKKINIYKEMITKRKFNIKEMNYDEAKKISKWTYKEPYSIYSFDESDECISELLNGDYYSASDVENNLVGYYCFGRAAQVPVGNKFGVYDSKDFTDIGLGIKPDSCGLGLGADFVKSGLMFSKNKLCANKFRLTVAEFNERAIRVYEKAGFKRVSSFERISEAGKVKFLVMILI